MYIYSDLYDDIYWLTWGITELREKTKFLHNFNLRSASSLLAWSAISPASSCIYIYIYISILIYNDHPPSSLINHGWSFSRAIQTASCVRRESQTGCQSVCPVFSIVFYFLDANKCTDVMAVVVSRKNAKEACLVVAVCGIAVNASSPTRNSSLALRMYLLDTWIVYIRTDYIAVKKTVSTTWSVFYSIICPISLWMYPR